MHKSASIAISTAALAALTLDGGQAIAGVSSGTWPAAYPLPTSPGTVTSQTSTTAVVRSTDTVDVVQNKLDRMYLTQQECVLRLAVNKPRDYLCHNLTTGATDEIVFTFSALEPSPSDPARSQTNSFHFAR